MTRRTRLAIRIICLAAQVAIFGFIFFLAWSAIGDERERLAVGWASAGLFVGVFIGFWARR